MAIRNLLAHALGIITFISLAPASWAGDLFLGHLEKEALMEEFDPFRKHLVKERALAKIQVESAKIRLNKIARVHQKGYATETELARYQRTLAAAKHRQSVWNASQQIFEEISQLVIESKTTEKERDHVRIPLAPIQMPGVTTRYGNIDLFVVWKRPSPEVVARGVQLLDAQQAPNRIGERLADLQMEHTAEFSKAVEAMSDPHSSDQGKVEAQLITAAVQNHTSAQLIGQLQRDAARLEAFGQAIDRLDSQTFPLLSVPVGMLGSAWRYAANPTKKSVALCLPVAQAQSQAAGTLRLREVLLELGQARLQLMELGGQQSYVSKIELVRQRAHVKAIQTQLAAQQKLAEISQLQFQKLLGLAQELGISTEHTHESEGIANWPIVRIQSEVLASLPIFQDKPAEIYGLLRVMESWLAASANREIATLESEFRKQRYTQISRLRSATAAEKRRVQMEVKLAAAGLQSARDVAKIRGLEFFQWKEAAQQATEANFGGEPGIPKSVLAESAAISEAQGKLLDALRKERDIHLQLREDLVKELDRINQAGAASDFELHQAESMRELHEGNVLSMHPMQMSNSLQRQFVETLRNSTATTHLHGVPTEAHDLLVSIATVQNQPNAGLLKTLKAGTEWTQRRMEKTAQLVKKGYASKLEVSQLQQAVGQYEIVAHAEKQRFLVSKHAAAIAADVFPTDEGLRELPSPEFATVPEKSVPVITSPPTKDPLEMIQLDSSAAKIIQIPSMIPLNLIEDKALTAPERE